MKRRDFVKGVAAVPAAGALLSSSSLLSAEAGNPRAAKAAGQATSGASKSGASKTGTLPGYAGQFMSSDMYGLGPDGKPDPNYRATGMGSSRAHTKPDPAKPHQMKLTQEEQDIMDGKKGEVLAKVMKIVVAHGNAFGADKLVDLGGALHSSMYFGVAYMQPLIKIFNECAEAGLKAYAPYTVNPRPYDVYNVNNNPKDMQLIYEGYATQRDVDWIHVRLGAPDLNYRSCACYVDEIGNAPKPGTYVAWAESSAVNYGNSVLGLRTNRNATGMELLCGLLGKAPLFGLMTDEGRRAKWLVEVKTTKEPDWGVVGTAIGQKVVEDVPYITGLDKYLGGKVTNENMHLLKAMGSATASSGAVGLYHVDKVTPDAKEKGRKLLVEGYKTYVIDDAEQERVRGTFKNLWTKKDAKPTHCWIGCPHNTYKELTDWGKMVTEALKKRGQEKTAIPVILFCANVVRDRLVEEQPLLVGEMKRAGMKFTNMCTVSYAGMKGFSERVFGVTNSAKTRNYSTLRYFPNDVLLEIVMTGKIPS
jgi:predicted aconitase